MRSRQGFTLLEMLVAVTVSVILIGFLSAAILGILNGYTATRGNVLRSADANYALDQIVEDLEALVIPGVPTAEGLRVTPEPGGTIGLIEDGDAVWLTLLSGALDRDNSDPDPVPGAVRAVSYRLAYQDPIDGPGGSRPVYALYRSVASAAHSFAHALGVSNLQTGYWDSLPAAPTPAPLQPTAADAFLSANIVGFQVRFSCLDRGTPADPSDPDVRLFSSTSDTIVVSGSGIVVTDSGGTVNSSFTENGYDLIEISLTVLSPTGAQRVNAGASLEEMILKEGRTVIREVALSARK
jgi:prepilin-type N-terminal cleavage/methylation domain-containing protein